MATTFVYKCECICLGQSIAGILLEKPNTTLLKNSGCHQNSDDKTVNTIPLCADELGLMTWRFAGLRSGHRSFAAGEGSNESIVQTSSAHFVANWLEILQL